MTTDADLAAAREWLVKHQYQMPNVEFDGGVRASLAALLGRYREEQKERDAKVCDALKPGTWASDAAAAIREAT